MAWSAYFSFIFLASQYMAAANSHSMTCKQQIGGTLDFCPLGRGAQAGPFAALPPLASEMGASRTGRTSSSPSSPSFLWRLFKGRTPMRMSPENLMFSQKSYGSVYIHFAITMKKAQHIRRLRSALERRTLPVWLGRSTGWSGWSSPASWPVDSLGSISSASTWSASSSPGPSQAQKVFEELWPFTTNPHSSNRKL